MPGMSGFMLNPFNGTPKRATMDKEDEAKVISPAQATNDKSEPPTVETPQSASKGGNLLGSVMVDLNGKGKVSELACDGTAVTASQAMQNVDFRKPKDESYADWKIVLHIDGKESKVYYVHRAVMTAGSGVLGEEIQKNEEGELGESSFEVDEFTAAYFDDVLMFLYGFVTAPTAENAPWLYHWGHELKSTALKDAGETAVTYALREKKNIVHVWRCAVKLVCPMLMWWVHQRCHKAERMEKEYLDCDVL